MKKILLFTSLLLLLGATVVKADEVPISQMVTTSGESLITALTGANLWVNGSFAIEGFSVNNNEGKILIKSTDNLESQRIGGNVFFPSGYLHVRITSSQELPRRDFLYTEAAVDIPLTIENKKIVIPVKEYNAVATEMVGFRSYSGEQYRYQGTTNFKVIVNGDSNSGYRIKVKRA